mgnify:CR=1 FL=1
MFLSALVLVFLLACSPSQLPLPPGPPTATPTVEVVKGHHHLDVEWVALYLHTFGSLPSNFLTKAEAERLGWVPSKGNLWVVAPGAAVGGDRFGNREGRLPAREGRQYYECDVNFRGGFRGPERLVYSSDGLIFYTGNHYGSFELLYGKVGN